MISVIIQSRGDNIVNIKHSISCFLKQTHKDKELILIIDQIFTKQSYQERIDTVFINTIHETIHIFSNINAKFVHNNVSAMRNFWTKQAKGKFILFMDDDEDVAPDYLSKTLEYRKKYREIGKKDFVLTPTLMYRHTGEIQNQWFSHFNYWMSRPIGCVLGQREWASIQMYSWNSLFAPAYIFKNHKMDERFDFVYEDLAYSYFLYRSWFPILVTKNIKIYHMERSKTKLEQARVGNIYQAYRKAKHRILFVREFANSWQKTQFYILWFRSQPLWLILKVIFYKGQHKGLIIRNILKWTIDGFKK